MGKFIEFLRSQIENTFQPGLSLLDRGWLYWVLTFAVLGLIYYIFGIRFPSVGDILVKVFSIGCILIIIIVIVGFVVLEFSNPSPLKQSDEVVPFDDDQKSEED